MLHTNEADSFLTCRLCNLCLKINQEHHCNNLPVSLKRYKSIKGKKCNLERWVYTERDGYIHCNNGWCDVKLNDTSKPCEYCFCLGCDSKKMIKMKNFVLIVMSAANKKVIGIIEKVLQKDFKSSKELKTCR